MDDGYAVKPAGSFKQRAQSLFVAHVSADILHVFAVMRRLTRQDQSAHRMGRVFEHTHERTAQMPVRACDDIKLFHKGHSCEHACLLIDKVLNIFPNCIIIRLYEIYNFQSVKVL